MAISFDLTAHDAQFHDGHFDEQAYKDGKVKCKFRDEMKNYEGVDDLSQAGNITDALEDSELLTSMIEAASDDDTRKKLQEDLKGTEEILAKILGKGSATTASKSGGLVQYGPNVPIPHDTKAFPDVKDAKWQDALANYGRSSYGWKSAGSGSTSPHYIDFGGKRYFVKKAGVNPTYTKEAARNEANANNFLRMAGLNAPDSMYLKAADGGRFCITSGSDLSGGTLDGHLRDKKIAEQVRAAYPVMALMYNMDIMQNSDNAFVDGNGNALFLDNGSTFGFSAQGARNKRFDFDGRDNPFPSNSLNGGLMGLLNVGNNSSANWNAAFGGKASQEDVLKESAKYDMGALAREAQKQGLLKQMPQNGQAAFIKYADEVDKLSAKYKQPKKQVVRQQVSSTSAQSAPVSSVQASVSRPQAPVSSAPKGKLSAKAVARLQAMSSRNGNSSVQQNAINALMSRGGGTPQQSVATNPTQQTPTPVHAAHANPQVANPTVANTAPQPHQRSVAILQRMMGRSGTSASQQASMQALINRFNGSAI